MSGNVRIEEADGILAITLARPDRRNAITVAMYAELADAIEKAASSQSIRIITLRGEGQDFTAGNDLHDFLAELPRISDDIPVWRLLRALARNQVPLVAAVQGNAVGIGTTMLLHCDLVIAEESGRFLLPFVDLGLVPEAASTLLLPELAGRRRAARYLLLGEGFGSAEALDIGLASHVVADGQSAETLKELATALAAKPPQALQLTQRLLREASVDAVVERMQVENGHFAERLQSAEVKSAIAAFFERRPDRGNHSDR